MDGDAFNPLRRWTLRQLQFFQDGKDDPDRGTMHFGKSRTRTRPVYGPEYIPVILSLRTC